MQGSINEWQWLVIGGHDVYHHCGGLQGKKCKNSKLQALVKLEDFKLCKSSKLQGLANVMAMVDSHSWSSKMKTTIDSLQSKLQVQK
jgi:hypothetical protein